MTISPRDLSLYIEQTADTVFDWRTANCVHFAARWVEIVEHQNLIGALADASSARDAKRRIDKRGGLLEATTAALGRTPIAPALAQAGDIVSVPTGLHGRALGICCGRTAAFRFDPTGIAHRQMSEIDAAWPIGRGA